MHVFELCEEAGVSREPPGPQHKHTENMQTPYREALLSPTVIHLLSVKSHLVVLTQSMSLENLLFQVMVFCQHLSLPDIKANWAGKAVIQMPQATENNNSCVQLQGQLQCCPHDYKMTDRAEPFHFLHGWVAELWISHAFLSHLFIWDTAQSNNTRHIVIGEIPETWDDSIRHKVKWNAKPKVRVKTIFSWCRWKIWKCLLRLWR